MRRGSSISNALGPIAAIASNFRISAARLAPRSAPAASVNCSLASVAPFPKLSQGISPVLALPWYWTEIVDGMRVRIKWFASAL